MGNDRVAVCVSSKFLRQIIDCVMWVFAAYLEVNCDTHKPIISLYLLKMFFKGHIITKRSLCVSHSRFVLRT